MLIILKVGRLVARKEGKKDGEREGGRQRKGSWEKGMEGRREGQDHAHFKKCMYLMRNSLIPSSTVIYRAACLVLS